MRTAIAVHSNDTTAVHTFGEKIDINNCDALAAQCGRYFSDDALLTIVFDLENVRLIDSYGLKFLINSQRKAKAAGKRLVLYRPDAILKEMLATTKLSQLFNISDT
jgi:anti-anti-sigma factor